MIDSPKEIVFSQDTKQKNSSVPATLLQGVNWNVPIDGDQT